MDAGYIIGFVGIALGLCVAPPQLYKIIKTGKTGDISLATYIFLCVAIGCYLWHAIYISSSVFITAQSVNLTTNSIVLCLLIKSKRRVE